MNRPAAVQGGVLTVLVVVLAVIIWHDINPSDDFQTTYNLQGYHPWVSKIFPEGRLSDPKPVADGFVQELKAEPVYMTLHLPRTMDRVTIRLAYRANNLSIVKIGLQQQPIAVGDTWHYDLRDVAIASTAGWSTIKQTFSLQNADVTNGTIRFIIAEPGFNPAQSSLSLHQLDFELQGKPYNLNDALAALGRKFARLFS